MGANTFGLYAYTTENIGDDIQSIAARRFLPRIDHYINRDLVGGWRNGNQKEHVKLITNGWYMNAPYQWPIQDTTLDPLYVSMYVEQSDPTVVNRLLSDDSRRNFKAFGKIGVRDESTHDFFKKNGIDSYVSGCVTLTLQRDEKIKKQDFILLTDVSKEVYEFVRKSTKREVIYLTNAITSPALSTEQRMQLAETYLYLYQSAHCVVTERLHTALPCLAFETPVILLKKSNPIGGNKNRFAGLGDLTHYYTEEEFLTGNIFDLEQPPKNPTEYLKYRNELIKTCTEFTGFNDEASFARSDVAEKPLDEVLADLEWIKAISLRYTTTALIQATNQKDDLAKVVGQKDAEIAHLMGIKASARRFAGNVKRRMAKEIKNGR